MRTKLLTKIVPVLMGEGFDWYVDSVGGNDGNDGRSEYTAFVTITKLLTVFAQGESVGLAKGSEWLEQLTLPGSGCNVDTYGSGNKPVFDCSDVAVNASFDKTDEQVNIYEIEVTIDFTLSKTFNRVWEDDVQLERADDLADCDATPGSYYVAVEDVSPQTIFVHASDSSDITANGKVYEYAARKYGVLMNESCTVKGIAAKRNLDNNGSIILYNNCTLSDCEANEGGFHNVSIKGGCVLKNITATDAYHTSAHSYFVINENDGAGQDVELINCQAISSTQDALGNGFSGHYNTANAFGTLSYEGCSVERLINGFVFTAGHATQINYISCETDNVQFPFTPNNDCTMSGGSIKNTDDVVNVRGVTISTANIVTISGLDIDLPDVTGGAIYINGAATVTVTDCTINLSQVAGVKTGIYCNNAGATISVSGCSFTGNLSTYYNITTTPTLTSDYNYFHLSTNNFYYDGDLYTDLGAWQGLGYDLNSTAD